MRSRSRRASASSDVHRQAIACRRLASGGRCRKAGNLSRLDPRQPAGSRRADHRPVVNPGQPGLIDDRGPDGTDARQLHGAAAPGYARARPDDERPLLPGLHRGGQHDAEPRGAGWERRRMPRQRIVQPLDLDLLGEPCRAQVDFQLGCRAAMEGPVEAAIQPGRGVRDEELSARSHRTGRPAARGIPAPRPIAATPPRRSIDWPRAASPRPGATSRPASSRNSRTTWSSSRMTVVRPRVHVASTGASPGCARSRPRVCERGPGIRSTVAWDSPSRTTVTRVADSCRSIR